MLFGELRLNELALLNIWVSPFFRKARCGPDERCSACDYEMGRPYVAIRLTERRAKSRHTMRYRHVP
jgi:hypothetical protein